MGWKAAQKSFSQWKILRGDKVMIMTGKDKGLTGTVRKVFRRDNRVIVEGRNLVKKHLKRTADSPGGIVTMEASIHVSNVQHIDPVSGSPCRINFRFLEDGTRIRISAGNSASGSIIPRPEILAQRKVREAGPSDTRKEDVLERTYDPITRQGFLPSCDIFSALKISKFLHGSPLQSDGHNDIV